MDLLKKATFWKWATAAAAVLGFLIASRFMPVEQWIRDLVSMADQKGAGGMALFSAVYIVAMVACVWGTPFTVAAGMVFGIWWGTAVAVFSVTSGSTIAFLIARYLARDAVETWAEGNEKFKAIDAAIGRSGWQIVFLTRFSPIIPFSISNYLFGLTKIGLWSFVWASAGAITPGSFIVAYLGHVGRLALLDEWGKPDGWHYALMAVALVSTIGILLYFAQVARRALAELSPKEARSLERVGIRP